MTLPFADRPPSSRGDRLVVAGRYRLDRVLGAGSFGEVWRAQDVVTGRAVAVKLLRPEYEIASSHAQLEVLALRQRLPGVVELLDEGTEGEQAFLVMELVDGKPFPGRPLPAAWSDIADVVAALLSTLARVHAAFVIHRDLKPANVLITADDQVKLLDFGIAYRPSGVAADSEDESDVLGTPAYMAPEQLRRQALSEQTDIYALGWMLYEALAGGLPHESGRDPRSALWKRLNERATPLLEAAPSVPPNVARLIDRMIALDPAERPASAFEVLAVLRGENAVEDPLFPWLGPRASLQAVIDAAEQGRSIDVVGPEGHGRTRLLLGARQVLSAGRRVHWIEPVPGAGQPLECLLPVTGPLDPPPADVERTARDRVAAALGRGEVLLVDDLDAIDPASRAVLDSVRSAGAVVRALSAPLPDGGEAVSLSPLRESDLRSLFAGPDKLLHLREDAARLLYERTSGVPVRVVREVTDWLRLGLARWTRSLLVVPRSSLDRLTEAAPRSERSAEAARRAFAIEAAALATQRIAEGRLGEAVASVERGLRAVRGLGPGAAEETSMLFAVWAEAALEEGTPHGADRLLYSLYRSDPHPHKGVVESLALAMRVEDVDSDRAMSLADWIPEQADARLERLRARVRMRAAYLHGDDAAEPLLTALSRSSAARDEEIAARIEHERGRLRYRQGRYLEAAALHESAAARPGSVLRRVEAMCSAAWALLEAFELDRAAAIAIEARELAAGLRHATFETFATWSVRAVAYRKRETSGPDTDLVAAVGYAVSRRVQGTTLITEAAAAWRSGHPEAMRLARASHELLSSLDEKRGSLLMRCLMIAQGADVPPSDLAALRERACASQGAGIGIQALGLLSLGGRLAPGAVSPDRIAALANEIPPAFWDTPVDVLSVAESLDALRRAGATGCPEPPPHPVTAASPAGSPR